MRDLRHDDDLGRQLLLEPLLALVQPASVLVCSIDDIARQSEPCSLASDVVACDAADLGTALEQTGDIDAVWLRGAPTWHSLRALQPIIVEHASRRAHAPLVVVEGPLPRPAEPIRSESAKNGVRLALGALAERIDPHGTVLWWAPGRGAGAFVPSTRAHSLNSWLADRGLLLDAAQRLHDRNVALTADSFALFELLDQSQHNAVEIVRSLRFRVGTRAVRLGRKLLRKERPFRAPVEILGRAPRVERWRTRLHASYGSPPIAGASDPLRVTFVVPELRLAGGVLAVLQLVSELRRLDVDARVVALKDRRREVFPWRVAVRPAVYDGTDDAAHRTTETDIIVATHWRTVGLARSMVDRGRAARAAYFVQDYEPWFHDERDSEARARVRATYESISHRIVTSEWLRGLLENDGFDAVTIPLGVDLGFFYPRAHGDRPIVLAMARPRTPRRGFETLVAALTRVHEATPGAEIVLFGEDLRDVPVPFPYTAAGVVTDREELAVLYSSARVLVDVSDFQAFGLPTLEAMACGTVCVATDVGGVHEYARDRENCLLVPARDPDAAADAVVRLLTDDALHRRLRDGALEGSARHSIVRVAQDMLQAFEKIKASPA